MLEINIPSLKTFFSGKPYKPNFIDILFMKIKEKRSEGFDLIQTDSDGKKKTYFILMDGDPFGALLIEDRSFKLLNGRDYFNLLGSLPNMSISMYAVDPVFAKCLLAPSQGKPSFSGPVNEKDIKIKIETIKADYDENIVLLKDNDVVNFFYFKNGKGIESYFFHPDQRPDEADITDQFLVYALSHDCSALSMEVYHKTAIHPILDKALTPEEVSVGISNYFLKQKPKPTSLEKLDFDLELEVEPAAPAPVQAHSSKEPAKEAGAQNGKGKWYLELVGGEQMGRRLVLNKPKLMIGRMKADLMLGDVKVSRQHAEIELTDQGYRFTDLASTNGSFINGQQVTTQVLKPGDLIRLGGTLIKIQVE